MFNNSSICIAIVVLFQFLIKKFSRKYKIAVLSRGYKRKTKGFIIASEKDDASTIGDEPFQYYSKFKNIKVAVDKKLSLIHI